jgi:hypothetical protein
VCQLHIILRRRRDRYAAVAEPRCTRVLIVIFLEDRDGVDPDDDDDVLVSRVLSIQRICVSWTFSISADSPLPSRPKKLLFLAMHYR